MAQEMRASGNIAAAIYYEVEAKQLQIKGIKLATEIKKLELDADIKIIEVERLKLTSTGDLRKAEELALDTKLKLINAKQLELGLSVEVIRGLENEITTIRNGNTARGNETSARVDTASATNAQADAMDKLEMRYKLSADYTERQIALLEREAAAAEKAIAAELKRLNIDKDKFSVDKDGKRIEQSVQTKESVFNAAKDRGLTDDQAKQLSSRFIGNRGELTGFGSADFSRGENWGTELEKAIKELLRQNKSLAGNTPVVGTTNQSSNSTTNSPTNTPSVGSARVVNIQVGGNTYPVNTDAQSAANLVNAFKQSARSAGR
jgi:hypothetical protein